MPGNSPNFQHPEIDPHINPDGLIDEQPVDNLTSNASIVIPFILAVQQHTILSTHMACFSLMGTQANSAATPTLTNSDTPPVSPSRSNNASPTFFNRKRTKIVNDLNPLLGSLGSAASIVTASKSNAEKLAEIEDFAQESILEGYKCPISLSIMTDPVYILGDTTTQKFERQCIAEWLRKNGTHPTTRAPFSEGELQSDDTLRNEINEFVQRAECGDHRLKNTI